MGRNERSPQHHHHHHHRKRRRRRTRFRRTKTTTTMRARFCLEGHLFDAFKFTSVSKNPLVKISMHVFEKFLPDLFVKRRRRTKEANAKTNFARKIKQWVSQIESSYQDSIDYHNRAHATDVTQSIGYMLGNGLREELDDVEVFALICTAVAHDCGHREVESVFSRDEEREGEEMEQRSGEREWARGIRYRGV